MKAAAIKLREEPKIRRRTVYPNEQATPFSKHLCVDGSVTYVFPCSPVAMLCRAKRPPGLLGEGKDVRRRGAVKTARVWHSVVEVQRSGYRSGSAVVADSYWHGPDRVGPPPIEWDEGATR